jgi:hypothetical protein
VTLSIGGVTFADHRACAPEHLVNAADQALYRAKRAGRDCVQFAPDRAILVGFHGDSLGATSNDSRIRARNASVVRPFKSRTTWLCPRFGRIH